MTALANGRPLETQPASLEGPSFIMVGSLRAGTTLLRLLMEGHPRIGTLGEFEESVSQVQNDGWPNLENYRRWMLEDRVCQTVGYEGLAEVENYPELVNRMWAFKSRASDKPHLGCTIHSRFDRLPELFPNAKYIFLVRDPRPVAMSTIGMGWVGEPVSGTPYWTEPVERWLGMRARLDPSSYIEIRYEDLLRDTVGVLGRCCALLGETYDAEMLAVDKRSTYSPVDPKNADAWRRKIDSRACELIELRCGSLMEQFGYQRKYSDVQPPSWAEEKQLAVQNLIGRLKFRRRRYGLGLMVSWAVVKRTLPAGAPIRSQVNRAIAEIDRKHLR